MKTDLFQSCGHCWLFQICWYIECNAFTALSFRIWNSSTGIPSPPLALFIVMLPKAHLTSHSRMLYWLCQNLWLCDHNKLCKILKEMGIPDHLTASWETCMQVKKQQLKLDMEQQTGSKSVKEYVKAVYYHRAYLTYTHHEKCQAGWSTSWNQDCWEKY